jgi:hypothetical protein
MSHVISSLNLPRPLYAAMYSSCDWNIFFFLQAESAIAALNCSGVVLGSLPIRLDSLLFHFPSWIYFGKLFVVWLCALFIKLIFGVVYDQGQPIKDTGPPSCSSSSPTLNHLWHPRVIYRSSLNIFKYTHTPCKDFHLWLSV